MDNIGKYEIQRKLGDGATSIVYLARDPFAQRDVAIKLIDPEVLQDNARGKLYRHLLTNEASLAGKLNHPHIVQIYDAVISDKESYIVMEYVAGGTLEPYCTPSHLLPFERVVEIIFKCTRALDYANRQGITHRDIKPANILLTQSAEKGDIKISDFGAALVTSLEQTRTQVAGVGSPSYMSPQQVADMPLNHQTDIYSLGVMMYQLLTGRLPFQANSNYSMVYQITNVDPPPPSTYRSDIPPSLDRIVSRAMQKKLDARYADWDAFAHDLAQSFRNQQISVQKKDVSETEKFETLRDMSFFREFTDVELWEVLRFSSWDDYAAGTLVMKEGEAGESFCFVAEGEARVTKRGSLLTLLLPGDCFGEMAVVGRTQRIRSADVSTQTPARIITIRGEALLRATDSCRMHFYQAFLELLSGRLAMASSRLAAP